MHSANPEPAPHGGHDDLSSVLSEVLAADTELAAAEARRVRALARAGHLALDAMAAQRASSKMAEMALREVASEIAAAAHLSDRSVQAQIGRAVELVDDYPVTLAAWEAGALSRAPRVGDRGCRAPGARGAARRVRRVRGRHCRGDEPRAAEDPSRGSRRTAAAHDDHRTASGRACDAKRAGRAR
ncbi:hypothetical protein [Microbacterium sp.]|uniref:hypothetical protein n=1 Tax=Microbacterium sp. TaxID=51671 RepID=UPI0025F2DFFB|nr:hypothetical protein [Microbacterium sp.]